MIVEISHPDPAQLAAFNQGRLDDEAVTTAIEAHLDTCIDCRLSLESLAKDTLESLVCSADSSPASSERVEPVPAELEYFRIESVLGRGGMGTVYLADDTRLHRKVAVKTLKRALAEKPGARDRFRREARAAAGLEHDNVIPIYYVGEADGIPFLAMPLLKGMSLDAYLGQTGGKLPPQAGVEIARQIAAGLAAAHDRGLTHRDIKPSNIWLEPNTGCPSGFRVKILDFGLAQAEEDDVELTQSGDIIGTPAYMSPEQARGEKVDARGDLWSLGVVLYVMTTGIRPFAARTTMGVLTSIAVDHPTAPTTLNPRCSLSLSNLVLRLLEKDPAQRPASAEAVIEALAKLEGESETLAACGADTLEVPLAENSLGTGSPSNQTAVLGDPSADVARKFGFHQRGRVMAVAVALALLPLSWLFGGNVYRFVTDQGELVIEVNDKDIQVEIRQNGLIVRDKTSGRKFTLAARQGEIEVYEKNGIKLTTKKFELTRGDKRTVTITLEDLASARKIKTPNAGKAVAKPPKVRDPDRWAAEYTLSVEGVIRINGEARDIRDVNQLPKEQFRMTSVSFAGLPQVGDAGLVCFQNCRHLTEIDMTSAAVSDNGLVYFKDNKNLTKLFLTCGTVTDQGLAYFKDCKHITQLSLGGTAVTDKGIAWFKDCDLTYLGITEVTDAGLAHFKGCPNLTHLTLGNRVTDAGVANFQNCKNLTQLHLLGGQVTDAGLASFQDCHKINDLYLYSLPATDAGLAAFKNCKNLSELRLNGTSVTGGCLSQLPHRKSLKVLNFFNTKLADADLIHVAGCANLQQLDLSKTQVSDAGLKSLEPLTRLRELNLVQTTVTFEAITRLQETLPDCHIIWDDPDRRAAEYVISVGGTIRVHGSGQDAHKDAELPKAPFRLADVDLNGSSKVNDAGLAHFANCRDLTSLEMQYTPVTDAGVAHFQNCKDLLYLDLRLSNVTDAGMVHFQGCKKLKSLFLSNTNLTDAAMPNFKDSKQLTVLRLGGIRLTDVGLASFQGCDELTLLDMEVAAITDAGLSNFKNCKKLQTIWLNSTPVTDVGLANFKDCKDLTFVNLQLTQVTDVTLNLFEGCQNLADLRLEGTFATDLGLRKLERLTKLQRLDLQQTLVTQAAVGRLQQLLPNCRIKWGDNLDPDRRGADYVFFVGGTVRIDDETRDLHSRDQLPAKPIRVTWVSLRNNQKLTDGGLGSLKGCKHLAVLHLSNTPLTDAGLVHFQGSKSLQVLDLNRTRVTDAGVAHFKDCTGLKVLEIEATPVTDVGLAHFRGCKNLNRLNLSGTRVTDAGIEPLAEMTNLEFLGLARTAVTDAGIQPLEKLTGLIHVDLVQTKVTPEGVARLKKALPKCKIDL
ncbi:MAG: hypothetical protein JWN70_339 [Planctomycetaceae bacterium]|nr:hypothetical protein [Planctomycetaceae bacterium]